MTILVENFNLSKLGVFEHSPDEYPTTNMQSGKIYFWEQCKTGPNMKTIQVIVWELTEMLQTLSNQK